MPCRRPALQRRSPIIRLRTLAGETTLLDLFGDRDTLLAIHNMGQGCRYCTLWADGFNGLLPHLESAHVCSPSVERPPGNPAPIRERPRVAFSTGLTRRRRLHP